MIAWWLASVALAGGVFVNGVRVDGALLDHRFEQVDVHIDAEGNIHIHAPRYRIEVVDDDNDAEATATASPRPPQPTAAASAAAAAQAASQPPQPTGEGVPPGTWWLVSDDERSAGHVVDVLVNGQLVRQIRSGEPQLILDIGRHLRPGTNQVRIESRSAGEGGGPLYVYVARGSNDSGTLVLDTPSVQYGLGASRTGVYSRDYTLDVR